MYALSKSYCIFVCPVLKGVLFHQQKHLLLHTALFEFDLGALFIRQTQILSLESKKKRKKSRVSKKKVSSTFRQVDWASDFIPSISLLTRQRALETFFFLLSHSSQTVSSITLIYYLQGATPFNWMPVKRCNREYFSLTLLIPQGVSEAKKLNDLSEIETALSIGSFVSPERLKWLLLVSQTYFLSFRYLMFVKQWPHVNLLCNHSTCATCSHCLPGWTHQIFHSLHRFLCKCNRYSLHTHHLHRSVCIVNDATSKQSKRQLFTRQWISSQIKQCHKHRIYFLLILHQLERWRIKQKF